MMYVCQNNTIYSMYVAIWIIYVLLNQVIFTGFQGWGSMWRGVSYICIVPRNMLLTRGTICSGTRYSGVPYKG